MANSIEKNTDHITTEHAVLIPPVPGASSIMAYVEAVATVIGSCHIHSVYEDQEYIKIYLNDKKFVDFLVNTGISVLGRRVNVDYAIPRADKVILKNIDPIIPDSILMRFLCYYGTPVSTIIHEKIANNLEYSHIECGTRLIYMNIFKDKKPPSKVSIQYQDTSYRFEMSVERFDKGVLEVDSSTTEETIDDDAVDEMQETESIEIAKPNISELNGDISKRSRSLKSPTLGPVTNRGRGRNKKNGENSITYAARKIKSRAAKGWYKNKITKAKNIVAPGKVATFPGAKVISPTRGRRGRGGFRGRGGRGSHSRNIVTTSTPTQETTLINTETEEIAEDTTEVEQISPAPNPTNEKRASRNISQYPLSTEEIKQFMFQTRCSRSPLQVAQEFLAKKNVPNSLDDLFKQLLEYHDAIKVQSLRIRIRRLVKTMQSAAANEKSS